jgi:hypothetical protein
MRRKNKTTLTARTAGILRNNDGTSLVLVTIIAILVIMGVVILRVATSSLWASSDKIYNQDRAYVLANSMGATVDALIHNDPEVLTTCTDPNGTVIVRDYPSQLPRASVVVTVVPSLSEAGSVNGYIVKIESKVADSTYVYTAYYVKSGASGRFMRQII